MLSIEYPHEKKLLLCSRSSDSLKGFALSVPKADLKGILDRLPRVKGFRPGKDAEFRLLKFFGRINRWTPEDWSLMSDIWVLWTKAHPAIGEVLSVTSKDSMDRLVDDVCSNVEMRRSTFMKLAAAARAGDLSQEVLRDWSDFGPFPTDADVEDLVALAPTKDELVSPHRLLSIESRLIQAEKTTKELEGHLRNATKQIHQTQKVVGEVEVIKSRLAEIVTQLAGVGSVVNRVEMELTNTTLGNTQLRDEVSRVSKKAAALVVDITQIQSDVKLVADDVQNLQNVGGQSSSDMETIIEQLEALRKRVEVAETINTDAHVDTAPPIVPSSNSPTIIKRVKITGDRVLLDSAESAAMHLSQNLNLLGVTRSHSKKTALDVVTGLVTGQIVTFEGSLAAVVAERCASSLTDSVYRIRIPVGLVDDRLLENCVDRLLEESADRLVSVILEGANCSAFEVYGPALRQLVVERSLGLRDSASSLLVFATLVEGPAMIPDRKNLAELGPILSTDALSYMDRVGAPSIPGVVLREAWLEGGQVTAVDSEWKDLLAPNWLLQMGGAVWQRTLLMAMHMSAHLDAEAKGSLEVGAANLAFGWLLPMACILAPGRVDEALELLKLDDRVTRARQLTPEEVILK